MSKTAMATKPEPPAAAVAFAKEELSDIESCVTGVHKFPDGSTKKITRSLFRGAHLAVKIMHCQKVENEKIPALYPAHEIRRELEELIEKSQVDPSAFDQLATCSRFCVSGDVRMPPYLRNWVCSFLEGSVSRPPTPRNKLRAKEDPYIFDLLVTMAVKQVAIKFGCPIQSDNSPRWSACEAVAKALYDMGLKPTTALQVYRVTTRTRGVNLKLARVTTDEL